ncbi:phospholipid phosphatase 2-like [Saimiri boliviensis]|uniref:phospholipid phosphatase 2-like n=1 Tax=Saimiri boliviensis TaxID=27679 RepID=UPI003D780BBB
MASRICHRGGVARGALLPSAFPGSLAKHSELRRVSLGPPTCCEKSSSLLVGAGLEAKAGVGAPWPSWFENLTAPRPFSPSSLPVLRCSVSLVNTPYNRGFDCGDDSIRYPYRPDTITLGLMAGVTITATVILVSAGEAYLVLTDRLYSCSDFNNYVAAMYKVLGTFLFGAAVSQSLTDLAKYTIGHLHPSFLAICDPEWSSVNCSVYVQLESVCRGKAADVTEARWVWTSSLHSEGSGS